jgi:uracil-DNA glycosylase
VSDSPDITARARETDRLYRAKARVEVAQADVLIDGADAVACQGDELADVVLVKGEPGEADRTAGRALAGADGDAAAKALDALGLPRTRFALCSRPTAADARARARRVRLIIEAVDPRVVIALDGAAGEDLAAAFSLSTLIPGTPVGVLGRELLVVDGLEASLTDEGRKRRVWRQFQSLAHRS